jgi:hypothetical protein
MWWRTLPIRGLLTSKPANLGKSLLLRALEQDPEAVTRWRGTRLNGVMFGEWLRRPFLGGGVLGGPCIS